MPSHDICQNAKLALEQVRPLKKAFDASFNSALSSGLTDDVQLAQEHKQKFLEKMTEVRMQMHAWEKRFVKMHESALEYSILLKKDSGEPLTKFELFLLYEFDTLSRFGLDRSYVDWRMTRNHEDDLSVMFDAFSYEIARSFDEMTPQTQIYIGKFDEPNFFQRIPDALELIYTEFPEKRIDCHDIRIGGKDEAELKALLKHKGFKIFEDAESMMEDDDFKRSLREPDPAEPDWKKWKLKLPEDITLIHLSVSDLGFPNAATTEQIYARAAELGLELCPPEVGIQFRLQYTNQPMNDRVYVGMKQISELSGFPHIFYVVRTDDTELWLDSKGAEPAIEWFSNAQFVFRLRKPTHQSVSEDEKPTT